MSTLPPLRFAKMHGLGNDFIVVDLRLGGAADWLDVPATIVALCDRRRGIGADGLLAILPPTIGGLAQGAVARLRILNADGSEPEMCGNGLRCVARYLGNSDGHSGQLAIETAAGVLGCTLFGDGDAGEVELAMGPPKWHPAELPQSLPLGDLLLPLHCVSMGNPHAILFCDDATSDDQLYRQAESLGPRIEHAPVFPRRTNVEFAWVKNPTTVKLVVWERGCGITQACGTGACATAVAACLSGRTDASQPITVHLPGGPLTIRIAPEYRQVYLRGPAVTVYSGRLPAA